MLVYDDVPRPVLSQGDALVKVHACGVSPDELSWSTAERLPVVLGHEISGIVEVLGRDVREVSAGDAVYALTDFMRDGGDAEYIAVCATDLAPKPNSLDFVPSDHLEWHSSHRTSML